MPDADEARALLRAVRGLGVPAWLSYSVDGGHTRAGQPLEEAFALAADVDEIVAVGVNCCAPRDARGGRADRGPASPASRSWSTLNSGEQWDAGARAWTGRATFAPELIEDWRRAGARLIGGCCRVGPAAVARIAAEAAVAARDV